MEGTASVVRRLLGAVTSQLLVVVLIDFDVTSRSRTGSIRVGSPNPSISSPLAHPRSQPRSRFQSDASGYGSCETRSLAM